MIPTLATLAVDANCDQLVHSFDPLFLSLKLVSRGLISPQQVWDILNRTKIRSERNPAFLNLIKSSPDHMWFSALLETLGEDKTTEWLKEVNQKSELL